MSTTAQLPRRSPKPIPRADDDFTEWLAAQRAGWLAVQRIENGEAPKSEKPPWLPQWVICNRYDDGHGRDPDSTEPELARPCELCGTSCYVKRGFVIEGRRVVDWFCFRRRGGRAAVIHPKIWGEIERAGLAAGEEWVAIGAMQKWLAEPDQKPAQSTGLNVRWWPKRQRKVGTN